VTIIAVEPAGSGGNIVFGTDAGKETILAKIAAGIKGPIYGSGGGSIKRWQSAP
jgi:hypothetical protein